MSHFLGTPSRSHLWTLAESRNGNAIHEAKNLRKRLLSGPTVDIYVGPEERHWSLHRNLLCHHSSYFETEFQGHEIPKKQKSSTQNRLDLPDDDPRGFELLVKWLYQGHLDDASHMTDEERYEYAVSCHKLYQLCDKFDMILVKNLAMDAYRFNLNAAQLVPDADEINEIYRSSPPGSPFRRLMIKIAARQIMDPGVDKDAESYRVCFEENADFAVELVNAIRKMSGGMLFDDPTEEDGCGEWHDHRDGSQCNVKGKGIVQVNGPRGLQQINHGPNSAGRRIQLPLVAELSSERPTPRKLNADRQATAKKRNSPAKQTAKLQGVITHLPATPTRPYVVSTQDDKSPRKSEQVKDTTTTKRPIPRPQQHNLPNRPTQLSQPAKRILPARTRPTPMKSSQNINRPTRFPIKLPSKNMNGGISDKASSVASGPRELSNVGGMVNQFDGVNGVLDDTRSESLAGVSGSGPPPKLKRKVPG